MRRAVSVLVCALVFAVLAPHALRAQAGAVRGRITVADSAAVSHATVLLVGTQFRATADENGGYLIRNVPPGTYTVRVRLLGYVPQSATARVPAGGTAEQDFAMEAQPISLSPIDVTVGSRAQHTAAEELAVPVDVLPAEVIKQQGTSETSQIIQQLAPSVNFPHQSVADATDIVRPFTMRGLGPDQSLVLVNGKRRHRMALVHVYGAALGAGSSGVDLNALPSGAFERIEVLRDGAAAQYGSDAIAGVLNMVLKEGPFPATVTADYGGYTPIDFPVDGRTMNFGGGWGLNLGRGSLALTGEFRDRDATNRAGPDPVDQLVAGDHDSIVGGRIVVKRNAVPQPNHHWGDGSSRDYLGFLNFKYPLTADRRSELYAFGGYSYRRGTGNGFRRTALDSRNWPQIYPMGFLPEFDPQVEDYSGNAGARGEMRGWTYDASASFGHNLFRYDLRNTLNSSLGPCLDLPCSPGPDGIYGTPDDPGIPNQTSFFAGSLVLNEQSATLDASRLVHAGWYAPINVAVGLSARREGYRIVPGEPASYIQGGHLDATGNPEPPGSQVFPGFQPAFAVDAWRTNIGAYVDLETSLFQGFLANAAARFENYSDFGSKLTGKLAARYQPNTHWTARAAASTGFRAPSLSQSYYASIVTNFGPDSLGHPTPYDVGIFPVDHPVSRALGATPLHAETSVNLSGGLAYSPWNDLTFTADAYYIAVNGRILLTAELTGDSIAAILGRAGQTAQSARYFTNALTTHTKGVDLTANWDRQLGGGRRLNVTANVSWNQTRVTDSTALPAQLAGTGTWRFDRLFEGGLNAIERERPDWRASLTTRYAWGSGWSALGRVSYYGSYTSSLLSYTDLQTYSPKAIIDAEFTKNLWGTLTVAVGGRNLLDTFPDKVLEVNSFGIMQYPTASPFGFNGRFLYARMEYQLGR
jgi:iron complex outermembrane recepter protein